ncbi:olfactory receptor 6C74-like [Ambystoma mexicanum]|uniref:olfactory receptor 6C74-like n=1 Tax=Ambystoma mexicanum TaxID=8296 RepID=UPI0037E7E23A
MIRSPPIDNWNGSFVAEFILLGLSDNPQVKVLLFVMFLVVYLITISGNIILITVCVHEPRLHTPMYFFLVNLSFLDIFYSCVFVPNYLVHLLQDIWSISFAGCAAQIFACLVLAVTESALLTIMAFDRYVAICFPLHYTSVMNSSTCTKMVVGSWLNACVLPLPVIVMTLRLPLCGNNVINNFFCEAITLVNMACVDTFFIEMVIFISGIFVLLIPILLISISYLNILMAILKIHSTEGRSRAFSTCASHLINVSVMYAAGIYMYMKPVPKNKTNQEKILAVFYTVGPPLWNPIIYSLRNKEIKLVMKNLLKK